MPDTQVPQTVELAPFDHDGEMCRADALRGQDPQEVQGEATGAAVERKSSKGPEGRLPG
jgi:hypothetical protein